MSKSLFLFDTNALIDIYRGRNRIKSAFDQLISGEIQAYLSVITEAELWRRLRVGELDAHNALIEQFTILPLNSEAACLAGSWMSRYQHRGLGWMDALIAASTKTAAVTLLTRDNKLALLLADELPFFVYA